MIERPRIIDVVRKPRKCPVCGERVVDIIYGTGDMTEIEYVMEYRREGMMGVTIFRAVHRYGSVSAGAGVSER